MSQSNKKLTVVLVDDHEAILQRASQLLETYVDVIGTAMDGGAAVDAVQQLRPDIVVLDIGLPVLDGLQVTRELKRRGYGGKIVFLTVENDPAWIGAAVKAGANGYVLKRYMRTDLAKALQEVGTGGRFVSTMLKN